MALGFFEAVDPIEQAKNPNYVASRRRMLEALQKEAMSTAPIKHWTQGGARLLNALANKYEEGQLAKGEREGLKENAAILASLFGGTGTAPGVSPAGAAVAPGGGPPPSPGAPARPAEVVVPDPSTTVPGAPVRGVAMPQEMAGGGTSGSPQDRDLAIRTILAEAGNQGPQGQAAVAAVIRNRMATGKWGSTPSDVVLAKNQFEPWNKPGNPNDPMRFDPNSPKYAAAAKIYDAVMTGQVPDPTRGATHFYAPVAQSALGRNTPAWARGQQGQKIGGHTFFAPEGRVSPGAQLPSAQADAFGASVTPGSPAIPPSPAQPYNVAQAGGAPVAPPQSNVQQRLMAAMGNPNFAAYIQKNPIALMMLQQQIGKDPITRQKQLLEIQQMQQNMQGGNPQQQEKARLELEALRKKINDGEPTNDVKNYRYGQKDPAFIAHQEKMKRAGAMRSEGAIPPGYSAVRDATGNVIRLEPIPGGKVAEAAKAQKVSEKSSASNVVDVIGDIEKAMSGATLPTTGAIGSRLANYGGTAANDVRRNLETLKANISFQKLNEMRQQSPTGGALGNVSNKETDLLGAVIRNLEQSQTKAQFVKNLGVVKDTYLKIIHGPDYKKAAAAPAGKPSLPGAGKVGVYNPATGKIEYQ